MKQVTTMAAQGDVMFRRVAKLPAGAKEAKTSARFVVAHSETGHHHVADNARGNVQYFTTDDPMRSYLRVTAAPPAKKKAKRATDDVAGAAAYVDVVHERDHDTHETLRLLADDKPDVIWEIRRQREWSPAGWRRVED